VKLSMDFTSSGIFFSPSKGKCVKNEVIPEDIVVQHAKDLCKEKFKDPKVDQGRIGTSEARFGELYFFFCVRSV
jgi:hypothetical protein